MGDDAKRERMSVERPEAEDAEPDDEHPADDADATAAPAESSERAELRCGIDLGTDED